MFEFLLKMLKADTMEKYVKENRNDDTRMGLIFIVASCIMTALVSIILLGLYNIVNPLFPSGTETIDTIVTLRDMGITFLMNVVVDIIGLSITYYIACFLGGKAKIGEFLYLGGQFAFLISLFDFVFNLSGVIPAVGCVISCIQIIFWIYGIYLFIILVSTLFSITKWKSFMAISIGWIFSLLIDLLITLLLLSGLGIDLGLKDVLETYNELMKTLASS